MSEDRLTLMRELVDSLNTAADAYYKAEYYGSINGPSVNFINNLSMAMVSVFGSLMFLAGGITLGNISSFVLYSRKFSGPINEFANIFAELQSTFAAADRVFSLLDAGIDFIDGLVEAIRGMGKDGERVR